MTLLTDFDNEFSIMNKPYLGLWAVLAVTLCAAIALSRFSGVADDLHLATADYMTTLFSPVKAEPTRPAAPADATAAPRASKPATAYRRPASVKPDTSGKTILFIGDSMLEGLSPRLAAYAKKNGHKMYSVIWYSSSTEVWGSSTKLQGYISQLHPDYVVICLGANELFVRDIAKKRRRYVDTMLRQIGKLPYIWIGPPNWKPDTGINDMLQEALAPGTFYLSNGQQFDRQRDGAHPTRKSAAAWMDRVCRWIVTSSAHPIKLDVPAEASAHCRTFVLQPVR